jgi:hypothetical protein
MSGNVPNWQVARSGLPGNLDAVNDPNHINQLLGAHPVTPLYSGLYVGGYYPDGGPNLTWLQPGNTLDLDQPVAWQSSYGSQVGYVLLPLQPQGNAADVRVSLCPDNGSGAPNLSAPLAATTLPAAWIKQLACPNGLPAGGPLASARYFSTLSTIPWTTTPWAGPGGSSGVLHSTSCAVSGQYLIMAGGWTNSGGSGTVYNNVHTAYYSGSGQLSNTIPQPVLPVATGFGALAVTSNTLILVGGFTTTQTSAVWTASWDPNTGVVGSWSSQTAYPVALDQMASATWTAASGNEYVYGIGGFNGSAASSAVYYSQVQNGQITSWNAGPSLPTAVFGPFTAVINGWLIVAGGTTNASTYPTVTNVYYAKILSDGSLGQWQTGPSLLVAVGNQAPGVGTAVTDSALIITGGEMNGWSGVLNAAQTLAVGPDGPAPYWGVFIIPGFDAMTGAFPNSAVPGGYDLVVASPDSSYYQWTTITAVPNIPVPLYATGLASGSTYHFVMQQRQATESDYVSFAVQPGQPWNAANLLTSPRWQNTWSTYSANWGIPIVPFSGAPGSGMPVAAWSDGGAATSVLVSTQNFGSGNLLTGVCEQASMPNNALNSNPTFASGVSPWTAVNGTLSQSNAQTQGGFAFSGLLTPTGGFAQAYAQSELIRIDAGSNQVQSGAAWFKPNGWFYSPTGWASFSLSLNWYDPNQGYLSTSSATVSLPATTWTQVTNYFAAPAGALYVAIAPTENGTPAATNLLYMSDVTVQPTPERVGALASVAQITYPAGSNWPPTGVVQLA